MVGLPGDIRLERPEPEEVAQGEAGEGRLRGQMIKRRERPKKVSSLPRMFPQIEFAEVSRRRWTPEKVLRCMRGTPTSGAQVIRRGTNPVLI